MATCDLINSEDERLDFTPFFVKFTEKKNWKFGIKIACENFGYYSPVT